LAGLNVKARDVELKKLWRQGIFNYIKQQLLHDDEPQLLRERQRQHDSELTLCSHCNGFFPVSISGDISAATHQTQLLTL